MRGSLAVSTAIAVRCDAQENGGAQQQMKCTRGSDFDHVEHRRGLYAARSFFEPGNPSQLSHSLLVMDWCLSLLCCRPLPCLSLRCVEVETQDPILADELDTCLPRTESFHMRSPHPRCMEVAMHLHTPKLTQFATGNGARDRPSCVRMRDEAVAANGGEPILW